jgi:AraC family L-rhamnose operon regulatory protein RhaS
MALLPRAHPVHQGHGREDYYGKRLLIPELRHLGWDSFSKAQPEALGEHRHEEGWEICYLVRGQVEWWVGSETHRVAGGQCYITRPAEAHGGVDRVMHPCELYWLQVLLPPQYPLPELSSAANQHICSAFSKMSLRVFDAQPLVMQYFERVLEEHRQSDEQSPLAARAALHLLLCEVARALVRLPTARVISEPVRRAMNLLTHQPDRPPTVEAVAKAVGLGASRFHERFVAEVGATPLEFLTRHRIELAQSQLRQGTSIAEAASQLGFTREYFTNVFRKVTGMSPAAWRTRVKHEPHP